eukprot:Phypoly_transcript_02615.p1 GENE.Phypoly_transcript_02615~~Phypoly_transcript_02615.p1  ORF type:complete len:912 (+),score=155.43 Phypoly_transcript_02615:173-2737(+)
MEFGAWVSSCCAAFSRICGEVWRGYCHFWGWLHDQFCVFCSLVVDLPFYTFEFVMDMPSNFHHLCVSGITASQEGFFELGRFTKTFVNDCCQLVSTCLDAMVDGIRSVPDLAKRQCANFRTGVNFLYSSFCSLCYSSTKSLLLVPLNRLYNFQYKMNTYFFVPKDKVATFSSSGARLVRVTRQELTIAESNGMATITISENFENSGYEFSYYFTLPKGAVVTNLELRTGNTVYNANIIPRGAAQQAYLERRKSPVKQTLLEEVGPSQYRLRIVQPGESPQFSFSYVTFPENGKWIFPVLTERRNIYWDMETVRIINGTESSFLLWRLDNDWMTTSLPASSPPSPPSSSSASSPSITPPITPATPTTPTPPSSPPTTPSCNSEPPKIFHPEPDREISTQAEKEIQSSPSVISLSSSFDPSIYDINTHPPPDPNPEPVPVFDEFDPDKDILAREGEQNRRYETRFFNPNTSECFSVVALQEEKGDRNLTSRNIAIVIDTSLRMQESKERIKKELEALIGIAKGENEKINMHVYLVGNEFYFGATKSQDLLSSDVDNLLSVFIGSVDMRQILYQFQQKRKEVYYKNVIVLTNQRNEYDQKDQKVFVWNNDEALSVVYLGDSDVTIYSDEVSDIIESSRGSIVKSALQAIAPGDANMASHDFGFIWSVSNSPCESHLSSRAHPYFRKLAARQLMHYLARDNSTLAYRHSLATSLRIVTSYSSFIITDARGQEIAKKYREQFNRKLENDRDKMHFDEWVKRNEQERPAAKKYQKSSFEYVPTSASLAPQPNSAEKHVRDDDSPISQEEDRSPEIQAPDTEYLDDNFFEFRRSSGSLRVPFFGLILFGLLCNMVCIILFY